jgi:hypothetical protein
MSGSSSETMIDPQSEAIVSASGDSPGVLEPGVLVVDVVGSRDVELLAVGSVAMVVGAPRASPVVEVGASTDVEDEARVDVVVPSSSDGSVTMVGGTPSTLEDESVGSGFAVGPPSVGSADEAVATMV